MFKSNPCPAVLVLASYQFETKKTHPFGATLHAPHRCRASPITTCVMRHTYSTIAVVIVTNSLSPFSLSAVPPRPLPDSVAGHADYQNFFLFLFTLNSPRPHSQRTHHQHEQRPVRPGTPVRGASTAFDSITQLHPTHAPCRLIVINARHGSTAFHRRSQRTRRYTNAGPGGLGSICPLSSPILHSLLQS